MGILDPTMDVSSAVSAAIEDHGPISFAEFMEIALYGKGGFYEDPPVGENGHFVTNPHVHPVFGELLAIALAQMWEVLDRPVPFRLAEIGAGDGTLAEQIAANLPMEFEYLAVEQSGPARRSLEQKGFRTSAEIKDLVGPFTGCVFANELLDNLPFHRIRNPQAGPTGGQPLEVRVTEQGGRFVESTSPFPPKLSAEAAAAGDRLALGGEATVPFAAFELVEELAAAASGGNAFVLFIDYGSGEGEPAGDVHGYRNQRLVEDVLDRPGTADITAGIDFELIASHAAGAGWQTFGPVDQQKALDALGFSEWNAKELGRQASMLNSGEGVAAVKTWEQRKRAATLVDPRAMGRLRWLLLATPGLPAPGPVWRAAGRLAK